MVSSATEGLSLEKLKTSMYRAACEKDNLAKRMEKDEIMPEPDNNTRQKIMELRGEAAELYEGIGFFRNAAFSYSRAATQAYRLENTEANIAYLRRAIKCYERGDIGEQHECIFNLSLYGRLLIQQGKKAEETNERNFLTGIGMSAIEEGKRRIKKRRIRPFKILRLIFREYEEARKEWDMRELPKREEFWREEI